METQAIGATDPFGSDKKTKRPGRHGRKPKRKRPPPWESGSTRNKLRARRTRREKRCKELQQGRKASSWSGKKEEGEMIEVQGPLDSLVAKAARRRMIQKLRRAEKERREEDEWREKRVIAKSKEGPRLKDSKRKMRNPMGGRGRAKWDMTFHEAFAEAQKRRPQEGPPDLCDKKHRRLLILYMTTKKPTIDWDRIEERWGTPFPELTLARLVEKLQRPGRARPAWRIIENRMREKLIPTRRQLQHEVDGRIDKNVVRRTVRAQVREAHLPPEVAKWVMEELSVKLRKGRTFFDARN